VFFLQIALPYFFPHLLVAPKKVTPYFDPFFAAPNLSRLLLDAVRLPFP